MAERDETRGKTARGIFPSSPACGQWETLLADALDGLLRPEDEATFATHMAGCAACTEMFEEARRGREWLEFLSPEPEVPAHLLEKILTGTGHGQATPGRLAVAGAPSVMAMPPVWQQTGFSARMWRFAEPRLMMTAAMAFFSIALTLNLTGIRLTGLRLSDMTPANIQNALSRQIYGAKSQMVRYYDNLRFVYEVELKMREFRRDEETSRPPAQQKPANNPPANNPKSGGTSKNAPQQDILWGRPTLACERRPQVCHRRRDKVQQAQIRQQRFWSRMDETRQKGAWHELRQPSRYSGCSLLPKLRKGPVRSVRTVGFRCHLLRAVPRRQIRNWRYCL